MDKQDFFTANNPSVSSSRILYTASGFAKSSLIYLQEMGNLTALRQHTSKRSNLPSFLWFLVESGHGYLSYAGRDYALSVGDCVFISCRYSYAHTCSDLWSLRWCHFNSASMLGIYEKYVERGGTPVFRPRDISAYRGVWERLWSIANSSDYIRDMKLNEQLSVLLTLIMEESWHPGSGNAGKRKKIDCTEVREFLEEHYRETIPLDRLAEQFHLNKYYLTRIYREQFGLTINQYLLQFRITKAKQMLRFTDEKIESIGFACGIGEPQYFSRVFRKLEGMSPSEYRERW